MSGGLTSHSRQMATTDYYNGRLRFGLDDHDNKLGREGRKAIGKYGTSPSGGTSSPTALRAMLDERQKEGGSWSSGTSNLKRPIKNSTSSRPSRSVHYSDNEVHIGSKYTSMSPTSSYNNDMNYKDTGSTYPHRTLSPTTGVRNYSRCQPLSRSNPPDFLSPERYGEPRPYIRDKKLVSTSCSRDCAQKHIVNRGDMTSHRYHYRDQMKTDDTEALNNVGSPSSPTYRHLSNSDHISHKDSLDLISKRGIKHALEDDDFKTNEIKHKDSLSLVTNCRKLNANEQSSPKHFGGKNSNWRENRFETTTGMTTGPRSPVRHNNLDNSNSHKDYGFIYDEPKTTPKPRTSKTPELRESRSKQQNKEGTSSLGRRRVISPTNASYKNNLPIWKLPKSQTSKGT